MMDMAHPCCRMHRRVVQQVSYAARTTAGFTVRDAMTWKAVAVGDAVNANARMVNTIRRGIIDS